MRVCMGQRGRPMLEIACTLGARIRRRGETEPCSTKTVQMAERDSRLLSQAEVTGSQEPPLARARHRAHDATRGSGRSGPSGSQKAAAEVSLQSCSSATVSAVTPARSERSRREGVPRQAPSTLRATQAPLRWHPGAT